MKKILILTILFSLFAGFSSCSNDDNEPFVWEGDIEGYNPLLGVWRYDNTKVGLLFDDNKNLYRLDFVDYNNDAYIKTGGSKFEINKKAYSTSGGGITRYKLDGSKLILYLNQNNDDEVRYLTKIEEE